MAKKSKSPNDEPRPQSGRKAKLNSRNTPDKYSTDSFDPAKFPDWKEMPSLTGSPPVAKTIGTVVVAALAASAKGVLPTMRATPRRRRSATTSGNLV